MNILLNRLLTIINANEVNSTNYHIAQIFLHYLYEIKKYTIGDMAEFCNVSKSTISKFVREIGFDDYTDFRLSAIAAVEGVVYNYGINIVDYIKEYGIENYLSVLRNDIEVFENSLRDNKEQMAQLLQDITSYKKVAAFGVVFSQTVAFYLQYTLAFRKKIIYTSANDVRQEEYIRSADEDTLIIIFSNSGRYITEYQLMEGTPEKNIFNRTKAKIIVITFNKELKWDNRVDLCICLSYGSKVQNHPYFFQLISDIIGAEYEKK